MSDPKPLESTFAGVAPTVRAIFERALLGASLSVDDAVALGAVAGRDLLALCAVADHLRHEQAGDVVSYVVNRNINFTNVCVKACRFCAFSRAVRSEEGYFLPTEEVVRRALEARAHGATEVCIQAGLPPKMDGRLYIDLTRTIKEAAPDLHIHAWSPEEIKYGAGLSGLSFRDYLAALKDAGLGSLPGTSAEILDDDVRRRIAPGRISTAEWIEVIKAAHSLGLPTTATILYGHLESDRQRMEHLALLRSIQRDTGGFTEFVPLSFVHAEAPLFLRGITEKTGPTGNEEIRLYAISRLMLGADFRNIQVSWVKEGLRTAQWLLQCGANDFGGTLINESISTSAGAGHGQLVRPAELRHAIRDAGRTPAERTTDYRVRKAFSPSRDAVDEPEPLDAVEDAAATFGSYEALTRDERVRFRKATGT